MLTSQLHLPYVITNSMQPLHALSHLNITFRKAQSQYLHVSLKFGPLTELLSQTVSGYGLEVYNKTVGRSLLMTSLLW